MVIIIVIDSFLCTRATVHRDRAGYIEGKIINSNRVCKGVKEFSFCLFYVRIESMFLYLPSTKVQENKSLYVSKSIFLVCFLEGGIGEREI